MVQQHQTVKAFVKLGKFLGDYCDFANKGASFDAGEDRWLSQMDHVVTVSKHHNGWFTKDNVLYALKQWAGQLGHEQLSKWLSRYDITGNTQKTVAIIMAGNIPLVGFHDFLAVLLTGNRALVKLSSNDKLILPFIAKYLIHVEPQLENQLEFTTEVLTDFDSVIATGSNNTARYFEYYFGKKPNIIRKNRNSVAVLQGDETTEQLALLGEDVFRYYGLGCRSVSKLFVPKDYDFELFFKAIYPFKDILWENKYANNYDYNKAVYLMSEFKILDNGFLLLKEDEGYGSPIATLFYETYGDRLKLRERIISDSDNIQCVVASNFMDGEVTFGESQKPSLVDYADGVDTVEFLLKTS